ncbi:MAG: ATP-binding cassette domain-containing protein, partial [Myxococcota bacterium]
MSGNTIISFRGVTKSFGPNTIYDGIDLDIFQGETITVMGGSGTGKSVLLKMLIGLMKPDDGSIVF